MAIPIYIYMKPILDFLIEDWLMYQTLVGIGMVVVGSEIVIFSERITRITAALHRRTPGIELPRDWSRGEQYLWEF